MEDKVKKFRIGCLKVMISTILSSFSLIFLASFNLLHLDIDIYQAGVIAGFMQGMSFLILFSGFLNIFKVIFYS